MNFSRRELGCAVRFMDLLHPDINWKNIANGYGSENSEQIQQCFRCAASAFHLYHLAWGDYDIRKWEWPFHEIGTKGAFAHGDEPWTVLLRHTLRLIRAERKAAKP